MPRFQNETGAQSHVTWSMVWENWSGLDFCFIWISLSFKVKISGLITLPSLAPGSRKRRDPGNEVATLAVEHWARRKCAKSVSWWRLAQFFSIPDQICPTLLEALQWNEDTFWPLAIAQELLQVECLFDSCSLEICYRKFVIRSPSHKKQYFIQLSLLSHPSATTIRIQDPLILMNVRSNSLGKLRFLKSQDTKRLVISRRRLDKSCGPLAWPDTKR